MSELSWLAIGDEQNAPPISQPLPLPYAQDYLVGASIVNPSSGAVGFVPDFWLYQISNATNSEGYDINNHPALLTQLQQSNVFGVLLVDYWPGEPYTTYTDTSCAIINVSEDSAAVTTTTADECYPN